MEPTIEVTPSFSGEPVHRIPTCCETLTSLRPFERILAGLLLFLALGSGTVLLYRANTASLVLVPRQGGTHTEGTVGTPRFVNPLLALTDADRDLTSVVYAGLMTRDASGALVPELAEKYTMSEDGLTYTFTLRRDVVFHDEVPLTAADVAYTIEQAANPSIRSPLHADWDNVTVTVIDDHTISLTIPEPYAPFIENTTLGILPKHIWERVSPDEYPFSEFNISPIGAGPYSVGSVTRNKSGIPVSYELVANERYVLGTPYITNLVFRLYRNTEELMTAFENGAVDALYGVSPVHLERLLAAGTLPRAQLYRAPYIRTFGIFLNHNKQKLFLNDDVRAALELATPKEAIVRDVLLGYGTVLRGPIPVYLEHALPVATTSPQRMEGATTTPPETYDERLYRARALLEKGGWKRDEADGVYTRKRGEETERLATSISSVNTPEMIAVTEHVAEAWRELGIDVEIKVFDTSDLAESVIRPRRYDALLFGVEIGYELDLYAFWHSSQRNDPYLNIAQYADIESDKLLEQARTEQDEAKRAALLGQFSQRAEAQHAAIFIYAPDFLYLVRHSVGNIDLHPLTKASDRFNTVHTWYIETDRVWPFIRGLIAR